MICELYNDNFQNYKRYNIKKAQLVIADIPYNIGVNFYGFEVSRDFHKRAVNEMLTYKPIPQVSIFETIKEKEQVNQLGFTF